MQPIVYLAGPVTGQTEANAAHWRNTARTFFAMRGIKAISPVRDAPPLAPGEVYQVTHSAYDIGGSAQAIRTKCKTDVAMCDVVLAYLPMPKPGAWPSIGTIIEVARAAQLGKTVIVAFDETAVYPMLTNHPILLDCADAVFDNLPTAIEYIASLLGVYSTERR